jgi:peroxiredoxin Q/BCP
MVSVDKPEDNQRFAEQEQANFPMLSDPEMKVADAYGVLPAPNPDKPGAPRYAKRWTFYIGPDGKIAFIDKTGGAAQTANAGASLIAKLDELKVPKKK